MNMKFEEYFLLHGRFLMAMEAYVLANDEVSDPYYMARVLLESIGQKSVHNEEFRQLACDWFCKGSTLQLKQILSHTEFNEHNITHFNAFTLMDTIQTITTIPVKMQIVK